MVHTVRFVRLVAREHLPYLAEKPTVNASDPLRSAISVNTSPAAGKVELGDAGVTAVIAWSSSGY